MKKRRYESWLKNIYNTQAEEISCSECFDLVSSYVELELAHQNPQEKMPQVLQHLHQCPACRDEYETLRDLQRLENEGKAPSIDELKDAM